MDRTKDARNADEKVVSGFGSEWSRFPQAELDPDDRTEIFRDYFAIFPWHALPKRAVGADIGCGSGRWAALVAPRVERLHCVDASEVALGVARQQLANRRNVEFHMCSIDELPFADGSLDFAYSLGVLHHVPDTAAAIGSIASCLKPGAPLLLYLYYALENRPRWFRGLWRLTDFIRAAVAVLPDKPKQVLCELIAALTYWPLARFALLLDQLHILPASWPLAGYRHRSFYVMRTDSLDRFGTRLEKRFTRVQIEDMMMLAGLRGVVFSERSPYWCAIGFREAS